MRRTLPLLTPFLALGLLSLSACSGDTEKPRLKGERISILDLQKELTPNAERTSIAVTIPPALNNTDWPQTGGYPHHALQNVALGEATQLERIWSANIGKGSSRNLPLNATPIVAAGKVYTLDSRGTLRAFHDQTGKLIWQASVKHLSEDEAVISGGMAYDAGALYVTSGFNEILALNPDNGSILWRTTLSAGSRAAPTVLNGRVFVTGLNNNAIALDAATGKVIWEYEGVGETTGLLGAASPAADDLLVYPAFSTGDLVGLRVENGSVAWSDSLSNSLRLGGMAGLSDIRGLPVLHDDKLIAVSFGGKMAAFNKRNGSRIWQREISSAETPWVSGNAVFVFTNDYKLVGINVETGDIIWVTEVDKFKDMKDRDGDLSWTGPIMVSNRLLLVGSDGRMQEYNPADGALLNSWTIRKTIKLAPVVANGTLYVLSEDGSLIAYR